MWNKKLTPAVVLLFLIFKICVREVLLEDLPRNSSRQGRFYVDSNEDLQLTEDRYVPRFYLDRPKNRYSYFTSEFFSDDKRDRDPSKLNEENNATMPLIWQDFPQFIDNKLPDGGSLDKIDTSMATKLPTDKVDISIMSNYSHIVPKFPIYFTNPSTGVVYAISEVKEPGSLPKKDSSVVFNEGSTKAYNDGKYTLQCTMSESSVKPAKKIMVTPTPIITKRRTTKKSKSRNKKKSNSAKKRTETTRVQYEDPVLVQTFDNVMEDMYDKFEDVMTEKVVQKVRPRNITMTSSKSVFSNGKKKTRKRITPTRTRSTTPNSILKRRKLTKRMAPVTSPSIINSTKQTVRHTEQTTMKSYTHINDDYYLDYDDFNYDDGASDYFVGQSDEKFQFDKISKFKKIYTKPTQKSNNIKSGSSSSEEQSDVLEYVNDVISPFQEALSSLTEKAVDFIAPNEQYPKITEINKVDNTTIPLYTTVDSTTEKELNNDIGTGNTNSASWFGSWFGNKANKEIINITTEEPDWFDYWYDDEETTTTETPSVDNGNRSRWFFNWFESSESTTRLTTTTTSTTTTTTNTPFLTLIDPVKNAPNWFGVIAQHLVNATTNKLSTTVPNLVEDIPRKMSYNRYQIWRLHIKDQREYSAMEDYKNSAEGAKFQWLKGPSLRGPTDLLVPEKLTTDLQGTLNFEDISHEVLIFDLGKAITYESTSIQKITPKKFGHPLTWTRYHKYDDMIKFLEFFQGRYPSLVELIHIGRSYEGRPLVVIKIAKLQKSSVNSKLKRLKKKKNTYSKGIFIEAGTHGREWIGPATATWITRELVKIMRTNDSSTGHEFVKKSTWYILPVLNPDGYEYTHEYDRLWRKSRSKHISKPSGIFNSAMAWLQTDNSEKICYGVDLNRNWDHKWSQKGSSKSPCNEFYAGPAVFSEPETRAVSNFLINNKEHIKLFVSLHAYGQIISYPRSANISYGAQKIDDLMDVALVGTDALRTSGSRSRYRIDLSNDMTSTKSGTSDYFAMYEASIPYSYSIDLSDNGLHGYFLPASNIESTAKDAFEIIKSMADYI